MIKRSKQRESIMAFLATRYDHPTAEVVYQNVRKDLPNISLATVYRNLSLLSDLGQIQKISTGEGPDHFDGNPRPHHHFVCENCNAMIDLDMDDIDHINETASEQFEGEIYGHRILFYGLCPACAKKKDA